MRPIACVSASVMPKRTASVSRAWASLPLMPLSPRRSVPPSPGSTRTAFGSTVKSSTTTIAGRGSAAVAAVAGGT